MGPLEGPSFSLPASPRTLGFIVGGALFVGYLLLRAMGC